jgi:hypothetical protein
MDSTPLLQTAKNESALYDKWDRAKIHVPDDRKDIYEKRLKMIVDNTPDKDGLAYGLGRELYAFGYGYSELQKRSRARAGTIVALALVVIILIIVIIVLSTPDTSERLHASRTRRTDPY